MRLSRPSPLLNLPEPTSPVEAPPSPRLLSLNARRLRENARVLGLLGTASALGATAGVLGARAPLGVRTRAFFQAATGVNLFCLGTALAGGGAIRAQRLPWLGLRTTLRRSDLVQRALGVGLALDVGSAVLGALLLRRKGRTAWREGAGLSFLLHGAALLLFDAGVFRRNTQYHHKVAKLSRTSSGQLLRVVHA
jgi:hypothetical protein